MKWSENVILSEAKNRVVSAGRLLAIEATRPFAIAQGDNVAHFVRVSKHK